MILLKIPIGSFRVLGEFQIRFNRFELADKKGLTALARGGVIRSGGWTYAQTLEERQNEEDYNRSKSPLRKENRILQISGKNPSSS
jgi:hypothetical protein